MQFVSVRLIVKLVSKMQTARCPSQRANPIHPPNRRGSLAQLHWTNYTRLRWSFFTAGATAKKKIKRFLFFFTVVIPLLKYLVLFLISLLVLWSNYSENDKSSLGKRVGAFSVIKFTSRDSVHDLDTILMASNVIISCFMNRYLIRNNLNHIMCSIYLLQRYRWLFCL